jgi:hypothetical protein
METLSGRARMRCLVCGYEREWIELDAGWVVRDHRGWVTVPDLESKVENLRLIEKYGADCNHYCKNECSAEISQIVKKLRSLRSCFDGLTFPIGTLPDVDYKVLADTPEWVQFKSITQDMASIIR